MDAKGCFLGCLSSKQIQLHRRQGLWIVTSKRSGGLLGGLGVVIIAGVKQITERRTRITIVILKSLWGRSADRWRE